MAEYQILYWRDLPAQFRVYDGGRARSFKLPDAFQERIDRAAMEAGLTGTEAYLEQWHWSERSSRAGTPDEVARALTAKFAREG